MAAGISLTIREDDLTGAAIAALLQEHLDHMREITPRESIHALDIGALRRPEITFWSAWNGDELIGCGALKALDAQAGEVKSMRTIASYRGRGVGSRVLCHLIEEAKRRGYRQLFLETGALPAFDATRSFYAKHGFVACGPFGAYADDPNSAFMSKAL